MLVTPGTPSNIYVPFVIERDGQHEKVHDLFSKLLQDRIILISGVVNQQLADIVVAELLYLSASNPEKDVSVYINSPGGSVTSGFAIYDAMCLVKPDVCTYGIGLAASMGAFLLAGGTKGKRFALPNCRIMTHQVRGGTEGTCADMQVQFNEAKLLNDKIVGYLAEFTGQPLEKIRADCDRDFYLSAAEAKEYGLVDTVL